MLLNATAKQLFYIPLMVGSAEGCANTKSKIFTSGSQSLETVWRPVWGYFGDTFRGACQGAGRVSRGSAAHSCELFQRCVVVTFVGYQVSSL